MLAPVHPTAAEAAVLDLSDWRYSSPTQCIHYNVRNKWSK